MKIPTDPQIVVLISAQAEWDCVCGYYRNPKTEILPPGQTFQKELANRNVLFLHGGWGKVSAAASTQFIIDKWQPELIINIGTCGGLNGKVAVGDVILANETLIYDIYERMSNPAAAMAHYATEIELGFLCEPFPQKVHKTRLLSADQDIDPDLVFKLADDFHAIAADWESGAIAWVAARNKTHCLILRVVSDLVDTAGGELYNQGSFTEKTSEVLLPLLRSLPNWIRCSVWTNLK